MKQEKQTRDQELKRNHQEAAPEFSKRGQDQEKKDQDTPPEVVDNLEQRVKELATQFINNELDNPEDIYNNNGLFVLMLKYIYRYYLVDILRNNDNRYANRYDYRVLDKIFWIYTDLVYKYKKNTRPNIVEFTVFTRIDKNILYNAVKGHIKKLTSTDIDYIKSWFSECENSLLNTDNVFSIFLLKSQYGYNDNLQSVPLELQNNVLTPDSLPDLSGNVSRIEDHNNT